MPSVKYKSSSAQVFGGVSLSSSYIGERERGSEGEEGVEGERGVLCSSGAMPAMPARDLAPCP